mmetsp:Transcript_31005/g.42405  ORF Transcript_31005/g.42405 Transcript_31005/m.42405 type:complete len:856 (+) Transcript_31005:319-2886(+)
MESLWIKELRRRLFTPTLRKKSNDDTCQAEILEYKIVVNLLIGTARGDDENRLLSCLLHSLAQKYHSQLRREACGFYERSLTFDGENAQALLLSASCSSTLWTSSSMSEEVEKLERIDAQYRRGIACIRGGSTTCCSIACLTYADFLTLRMRDISHAEQYYVDACRLASESSTMWVFTTIALINFYIYDAVDNDKAHAFIRRTLSERHQALEVSLHSFKAFHTKVENENRQFINESFAALYVSIAYFLLNRLEEYDSKAASRYISAALAINNTYSPAWRCAALVALIDNKRLSIIYATKQAMDENWQDAIGFIDVSVKFSNDNPYTLRTSAILHTQRFDFPTSIALLQKSILIQPRDVLAHLLLGVHQCQYQQNYVTGLDSINAAITHLNDYSLEMESVRYLKFQCHRIKGQLLLFHGGRITESITSFQSCLLLRPWDSVSLACLALCRYFLTASASETTLSKRERFRLTKQTKNREKHLPVPFSSTIISAVPTTKSIIYNKRKQATIRSWADLINCEDSDLLFQAAISKDLRLKLSNRDGERNINQVDMIPGEVICWATQYEVAKSTPDGYRRAITMLLSALRPSQNKLSTTHNSMAYYMLGLLLEFYEEESFNGSDDNDWDLPYELNTPEKCFAIAVNGEVGTSTNCLSYLAVLKCVEQNLEDMRKKYHTLQQKLFQKPPSPIMTKLKLQSIKRNGDTKMKAKKKMTMILKNKINSQVSSPQAVDQLLKKLLSKSDDEVRVIADETLPLETNDEYSDQEIEDGKAEEIQQQNSILSLSRRLQVHQRIYDLAILQKVVHADVLNAFEVTNVTNSKRYSEIYVDDNEWKYFLLDSCYQCDDWGWMLRCSKIHRKN